jgi:DNA-binding NtrC family response regulator
MVYGLRHVLAVTKNNLILEGLKTALNGEFEMDSVDDLPSLMSVLKERKHDLVFFDLELVGTDGSSSNKLETEGLIKKIKEEHPSHLMVIITSPDKKRSAIEAVKAGAATYLTYPVKPVEVKYTLEKLYKTIQAQGELEYLRDSFWQRDFQEALRTKSSIMMAVYEQIKAVAPTRATVLLTGETGTGKTLLAKIIHQHSGRANKPFISVHCGAIPESLVESELFGHEKGAFTGAIKKKLGKFEIANGGTIFLDEIGTITPSVQIKLLQVLQDEVFQRVGGETNVSVDVRVIAATNVDLKTLVDNGVFRRDLYYRLNVFPIYVPPLRERKEDIPLLVELFLKQLNSYHMKNIKGVVPRVLEALERYDWPGNIRELENVMERAYILEKGDTLSPQSFPREIMAGHETKPLYIIGSSTLKEVRRQAVEEAEKRYIEDLLKLNGGRIDKSAFAAGVTTRQFRKLMRRYGLRKEQFKMMRKRVRPQAIPEQAQGPLF